MALSGREQDVVGAVPTGLLIGGEQREGAGGGRIDVDDPATGEVFASVADATADDGRAALDAAVAAQADWAATPPRDRGEILRRAFELLTERSDDLALLMTLEMGKPVAESKGEITYAAEFFRWFSEESVRISGRWSTAPERRLAAADDEAAGRALPVHHAVELPDGDGHPQDRPRGRGRLHDGGEAGVVHAAVDARPGRDHDRGRAAGRRPQRGDDVDHRRGDGAADPRPPAAQAVVHRLHRGRAAAGRAVGRAAAAGVDGARRQRAVPRLRRRRPRRRGRGRDARQDAQRRRGVHGGQPLPRAPRRRRRLLVPPRRADGRR